MVARSRERQQREHGADGFRIGVGMGHRGAELDFDAQQDRPKQWATKFEARPAQLKPETPTKLGAQLKQEAPPKRGMLLAQLKRCRRSLGRCRTGRRRRRRSLARSRIG
jgi:hypothetical protein